MRYSYLLCCGKFSFRFEIWHFALFKKIQMFSVDFFIEFSLKVSVENYCFWKTQRHLKRLQSTQRYFSSSAESGQCPPRKRRSTKEFLDIYFETVRPCWEYNINRSCSHQFKLADSVVWKFYFRLSGTSSSENEDMAQNEGNRVRAKSGISSYFHLRWGFLGIFTY